MSEPERALAFSHDALANRPLFLGGLNSVNIFVEDDGKEYEYEIVLERLLGEKADVFAIFPLGGKISVIQRCRNSGLCDSNGTPNIFLVDGDFDILWGDQVNAPNLIYLDRYNIESYFCSKEAVEGYMRGVLECRKQEVAGRINFNGWLQSLCDNGLRLFMLFALRRRYKPELPNAGQAPKYLGSDGRVSEERYCELLKETKAGLELSFDTYVQSLRQRLEEKFGDDEIAASVSIICGRYQIESLNRYLSTRCSVKLNSKYLRNTLISNFDLTPLAFLRERIIQLCATNN